MNVRRAWRRPDGSLRVRRLLLGAGFVLLGWALVAGVLLLDAVSSAVAGVDRLEAARASLEPEDVLDEAGETALAEAEREFSRARSRLDHPVLAPARFLPVIGRQLRTADAMVDSATELSAAGRVSLREVRAELDVAPADGPGRVAAVESILGAAARVATALDGVDLGPRDALLPPVARARADFEDAVAQARDLTNDTRRVGDAVESLLAGPSRYLVLAAHTGEMRAGSGMFLSVGILEVDAGALSLQPFEPTAELTLPAGAVEVEGDLADRWGWAEPGREWRNLALTPRFDVSAELAARMWEAAGREPVDGVLAVDPQALAGLMRVLGPVEVGGRRLEADNVLEYLYLGQYQDAVAAGGDQDARREVLADVAAAVLDTLEEGTWDTLALLDALTEAAEGRHLLLWSERPTDQEGWVTGGVGGLLRPQSLALSLLNTGANKLDVWLEVTGTSTLAASGDDTEVALRFELANRAPAELPRYVGGPTAVAAAGEYVGILAVNVPGSARDVRFDGNRSLVAAGPDGPTRVVATEVRIPRGATAEVTVRFVLPGRDPDVVVEPTARDPEVTWVAGPAAPG